MSNIIVTTGKLSKTPKLFFLSELLNPKYKSRLPTVLIQQILSFFDKCSCCNDYVEDSWKCQCARLWCKICTQKHIRYDKKNNTYYCNKCLTNDIDIIKLAAVLYKCIINECTSYATLGSIDYALYCIKHSSSKLLVCQSSLCGEPRCINIGIYINDNLILFCQQHHSNKFNPTLCITAGYKYKNKNMLVCQYCHDSVAIVYKCSCGIKRCSICAEACMFVFTDEKSKECTIYCNMCCTKIKNIDDNTKCSVTLPQYCGVINCVKQPKKYNIHDNLFFCDIHSNKDCIVDDNTNYCLHKQCYAIGYKFKDKKLCRYHYNEYIEFHNQYYSD